MCGIVGYSGQINSIEPVLEGLTRLEYRGYDSAGVCFKNAQGKLEFIKKEGKIDNLKSIINSTHPQSNIAIGHTRWATHGLVNDTNAHPHVEGDFAIVHNGIIENASALKKMLEAKGHIFHSQTDTEVFLKLVLDFAKTEKNILQIISSAFQKVQGNSAFVIMSVLDNCIYSIKRAAPLVCGENNSKKEVMCSSDPYALIGFAEKIYFPEDSVICRSVSENGDIRTEFYELDLTPSKRFKSQQKEMSLDIATKGAYEHFMLKEIHEQPRLILELATYYTVGAGKRVLDELKNLKPEFMHISACGTAWHAGLLIRNYLEQINDVRVGIELASEFRYKEPIIRKGDMGLFITQSGETADTLATLKMCQERNVKVVSIVNVEGSTIHRESDINLLTRAGAEIGVASTKAFSLQVLTGYLMSLSMANKLDVNKIHAQFELLSQRIEELLSRESEIRKIANKLSNHKGYIFTGRGRYFPIALEGALKLKEISYVHAEGYAAGELKHGPIAIIDHDMVNICLIGPELYDKAVSNMEEVKARRAIIFSVGSKDDQHVKEVSDYFFGLNFDGLGDLSPVYINIVMQLFSYYIAKMKGTDIDKPRNLAKSVTVE
jgi:glucosamine--fructose-6-phosphate aminotransferase (isomerizing)